MEAWEKAYFETRRSLWFRRRRLEQFTIKKKDRILDLGCGDGLNMMILRKMGKENIVGLDPSKVLIKRARENNPDIPLIVGRAEGLPFAANSFDVVLIDSVFHHLKTYQKSLQEIWRVLIESGRLCFVEPHSSLLRTLLDWVSESPFSAYIPLLRDRRHSYLLERSLMKQWLKKEKAFLQLLRKQGFQKHFCKVDLLSIMGEFTKL